MRSQHCPLWVFVVLALVSLCVVAVKRAENLSFSPPFLETDLSGKRVIPNYTLRGEALSESFKNFVRLTGDHEDTKGGIWSLDDTGPAAEWALVLRFRASGRLRWKHGDGLALWITRKSQRFALPITAFGAGSAFEGLGFFFDTSRTHYRGRLPRLTMLQSKDEASSAASVYPPTRDSENPAPGCYHAFRYDENRHDFSVANHTMAVIVYRNNVVKVGLRNSAASEFNQCFEQQVGKLPTELFLGVSASCGDRSDNHDILSLNFFDLADHKNDDDDVVWKAVLAAESALAVRPVLPPLVGVDSDVLEEVDRIIRNTHTMMQIDDSLDHLQHDFEHQILDFQDSLKYSIHTLEETGYKASKQIDANAMKIRQLQNSLGVELNKTDEMFIKQSELEEMDRQLEASIKKLWATERKFEQRLTALESEIDKRYHERFSTLVEYLAKAVEEKVEEIQDAEELHAWKMPFAAVVLIIIGLCVWTVRQYQAFMRRSYLSYYEA